MELDLEKGLPEEVNLFMDGWEYLQKVDYEQLLFKCRKCHEYGNFVKSLPKEATYDPKKIQEEGWQQVKIRKKALNNSPVLETFTIIHTLFGQIGLVKPLS